MWLLLSTYVRILQIILFLNIIRHFNESKLFSNPINNDVTSMVSIMTRRTGGWWWCILFIYVLILYWLWVEDCEPTASHITIFGYNIGNVVDTYDVSLTIFLIVCWSNGTLNISSSKIWKHLIVARIGLPIHAFFFVVYMYLYLFIWIYNLDICEKI